MNSFDFSMYDTEDVAKPSKTKTKQTPKKAEKFDFEEYEMPVQKEEKQSSQASSLSDTFEELKERHAGFGKTILKGAVEGVSRLGRIMGPLEDQQGRSTEELLEEQTKNLNELLPTEEGYVESSVRRGLREAPTLLAFPSSSIASLLPRQIAASFLGEGAKELGLPEWAQTAAELTAFIGPDITKKLLSGGKNKEIIDWARKAGFSDEQITPLIQSEFKQKWLAKISPKGGRTQEALSSTKEKLSESYSALSKSENAGKALSSAKKEHYLDVMRSKFKDMPADVRKKIARDFRDLASSEMTGKDLMNFHADVNHVLSDNAKQLSILKDPIKNALAEISPSLRKDFDMVNNLYSKYHKIASKLKPDIASKMISAGETLGLLGSLVTFNTPILSAIAGEKVARNIAREVLINPKFQQLSKKMVVALNQNKVPLAVKISKKMSEMLKNTDPESAKLLENLNEESFNELYP